MSDVRDRFLAAILDGDFPSALIAAQEARARSLAFLYESVVVPALAEVGRRWQAGRISIADEHVATALTQSVIASFYPSFPWATSGPRASSLASRASGTNSAREWPRTS